MVACARNGDFDLIITKEISRFARNTLDSIYYTRDLKKHGVGVIFLNDNINTLDGDAELRLAIMSSIAQEESRKTSERVKWGQKRRMEQGVVFGRSMLGYDVKDGKMYINEEGAEVVRLIFHKFVNEKKGTHVIARELREAGIRPMRRVKEWQNTVILRILRNEKYCGDLVQKKTYTPDFLSHEKKYNRGEEEFIIIKDHHRPIISREMFEEANRILDERSHSQQGKAKYSSRYPFSGKIRCGCCGSGYVARHKTRKNGSRYKAWRCSEAVKYGSPHIDEAGNKVGCTGMGIRNEDVVHVMCLVMRSLQYNTRKIKDNLISVIKSAIAMDDTDAEKLKLQIKAIQKKNTNFIELYTSGDITREEYMAARAKYDNEITELRSAIESVDLQRGTMEKQQELAAEIAETINGLVNGVEYEDDFYREILDKMVVIDKDNIDVYLNLLPFRWSYTAADSISRPQGRLFTGKHPPEASPRAERKKAKAPETGLWSGGSDRPPQCRCGALSEHFRGFCTYIRQRSHTHPVGHGIPLGQIAHTGAHLAVGSAVLADDGHGQLGVRVFDVYRILQSFFIVPHLATSSFPAALPGPWLHYPVPVAAAGPGQLHTVKGQRTVLVGIFFQKLPAHLVVFPEIIAGFFIVGMGVQVQQRIVGGKTHQVQLMKELFFISGGAALCSH